MAFTSVSNEVTQVGSGEVWGNKGIVLSSLFEDGLKVGVFCDHVGDEILNITGVAPAVVAGVVLRSPTTAVESGDTLSADLYPNANYARKGAVTVSADGAVPAKFADVYVSLDAGIEGYATATDSGVLAGAEFWEEVKPGVWLVYIK